MSVAVVRYNGGNVRSVVNALERLGVTYTVTNARAVLEAADRVIFPGVGEASGAMRYLCAQGLDGVLRSLRAPLLGICLGMQLLCESSEEGGTTGLGVIPAVVRRFRVPRKVPHMGWSQVGHDDHPLFWGVPPRSYFYFVHSYRVDLHESTVARCEYGEQFAAALCRGNVAGVQFHPEKSGPIGEVLLRNFLAWRGV